MNSIFTYRNKATARLSSLKDRLDNENMVNLEKGLLARWLEATAFLPVYAIKLSTNPFHKNLVRNIFPLMFKILQLKVGISSQTNQAGTMK